VLAVSVAVALAGATLAGCAHGAANAGEAAARLATARPAAHLTGPLPWQRTVKVDNPARRLARSQTLRTLAVIPPIGPAVRRF